MRPSYIFQPLKGVLHDDEERSAQNNFHNKALADCNDVNNLSYSIYHFNNDQVDRKYIGIIKDNIKYLYLNPDPRAALIRQPATIPRPSTLCEA